jgi:subtilisin family serine protease
MKILVTSFFVRQRLFLAILLAFLLLANPSFAATVPNDPYYGRQWYLERIKADEAWDEVPSSPDIVVAVIDSGIQINHPDLVDSLWKNKREIPNNYRDDDQNGFIDDVNGWDFVSNTPDPSPKFSDDWSEAGVAHGTMVAGVIAARGNNGQGVTGVSWQAQIMPLKALNDRGEGKMNDVIRAIDYAIINKANIINLSFVTFTYSSALQEAITRAHNAGVIVVAAAGNEPAGGSGYDIDKRPIYPACYDGELIGENMVIGVAATDALDQKAQFSSYGSRCVDIAAPGISFFNTITAGADRLDTSKIYDGYWSGTSLATPLVSATLALIAQANPELDKREIVSILFAATDNISRLNPDYPAQLGNGRLNVERAVEMAREKLQQKTSRLILVPEKGNAKPFVAEASGVRVSDWPIVTGGARLVAGDLDGQGVDSLVVGVNSGEEPRIKILSAQGKLIRSFLAFPANFKGGVDVALSDLDQDGRDEIIVVQASLGNGEVRIFNGQGKIKNSFLVDSRNWRGGLRVAAGDFTGTKNNQIVVAYSTGSQPQIRIFTAQGKIVSAFLAYEKSFLGGLALAVGNLDGRAGYNQDEIIVAPLGGREALVRVFDNRAQLKSNFLAFGRNWRGGINLAVGDLDNDGLAEIVAAARPGAAPHVRVFDERGIVKQSFYAWTEDFNGGVNPGIIKINN